MVQQILVFQIQGQRFGFPLEAVQELVPMCALSRPPAAPSLLEGLLNLAGEPLPVIRLDRLFGLAEARPGLHTPLIVLKGAPTPFAVVAEAAEGVRRPAPGEWTAIEPGLAFNGCVRAELREASGVVHVLDPARILLEQERLALAQFAAEERRRLAGLAGLADVPETGA